MFPLLTPRILLLTLPPRPQDLEPSVPRTPRPHPLSTEGLTGSRWGRDGSRERRTVTVWVGRERESEIYIETRPQGPFGR